MAGRFRADHVRRWEPGAVNVCGLGKGEREPDHGSSVNGRKGP
jgi:hypothetical protein